MNSNFDRIREHIYMHIDGISSVISDIEPSARHITIKRSAHVIFARPLTPQAESEMHLPKFNRIYANGKLIAIAVKFSKPVNIENLERQPNYKYFNQTLKNRLKDLKTSREIGEIEITDRLTLTESQCYNLEYKERIKSKKTTTYQDKPSHAFDNLTRPQKPFTEIQRVSLDYNTILILENKSLSRYLKNVNSLYTDSIMGYLLEHSNLLNPAYFKYPKSPREVKIKYKNLRKLYPHGTFKFVAPEGVEMTSNRPDAKRFADNDIITFNFSKSFLDRYRNIITKSAEKTEQTQFIKVPVFFILEALQNEKLTSNGLPFLLFILSLYRMPAPSITHTIRNLIKETQMDITHGFKKPIARLNTYLGYLQSVNVIENPIIVTNKDLDSREIDNGRQIRIRRPKRNKT